MNAPSVEYLRSRTTVSIAEAGAWLGMSTAAAYRAAQDGTLPVLRVGKRRRVPTPRLLALVGLSWDNTAGSSDAPLPSNGDGSAT